jgi:hypothetical protein
VNGSKYIYGTTAAGGRRYVGGLDVIILCCARERARETVTVLSQLQKEIAPGNKHVCHSYLDLPSTYYTHCNGIMYRSPLRNQRGRHRSGYLQTAMVDQHLLQSTVLMVSM